MCVVPVRGVHCWDWGGQAEQETVVGTRGQQENYLLGLGNDWSGSVLRAGSDEDRHCPLPALPAAPAQLCSNSGLALGVRNHKAAATALKQVTFTSRGCSFFPQRPSLAGPPQVRPFLLLCCPVLIVCMGINRSSEACSGWTAIEQG